MSDILSIGKSALSSAQVGISTTGHNIANANTPGFSRQIVSQESKQPQNFGQGFIGQGSNVTGVARVYNEMLARNVTSSQSASNRIETYKSQLSPIDNLLSDNEAGLNPAMNNFFSSVKNVNANPSDIPTRTAMLSDAQALTNRYNTMSNRLNQIQQDVNTQVEGYVTEVNGIAEQITRLNSIIQNAINVEGKQPNDLMDQRDSLVSDLSKVIKTTVTEQGTGSYNVFVGNGLPLVIGNDTFNLAATPNPTDPSRTEIGYQSRNKITILGKDSLAGGAMGGLIEFREDSLDSAQNKIGQLALVLADQFNQQHRQGFDLNGDPGADLFSIPGPATTAHRENTGTAAVGAVVADATAVTSSDYKIKYDGTNYNVTRSGDGNITSVGALPLTLDGLTISINSGAMNAGDEFVVRPTQNVAESLKLAFSDTNKLAFAGSATTGPSDNVNGLLLAKLQLDAVIQGPNDSTTKMSFTKAFATLTSEVGNKAHELNVTGAAEAQVLETATASFQSEVGVNLDEEAANLIRYQQAYQAAGKMMQMASELFNVILTLGR
jgi:flagellar hook-associated protein 1 FlgK